MYLDTINLFSGKTYDTPKINWDEEDKHAIIAFLLLSIDKKTDEEGKVRLDDLFGLNETAPESAGEETDKTNEKRKAKDAIIKECEKFLAGLEDHERYDAIQDAIDKFIEGQDSRNLKCVIGDSYGTFGGKQNKLEGTPYRLWDLAKLVVFDADYQGNKRRLLKHLARKWDIEGSVLPALEGAAKTLPAIAQEQRNLVESDKPFREVKALLAGLEEREKETWKQLEKLGVYEDRKVSAYVGLWRNLTNALDMRDICDPYFEADYENSPYGKMVEKVFSGEFTNPNDLQAYLSENGHYVSGSDAYCLWLVTLPEEQWRDEIKTRKMEPGIGEKVVDKIVDGICFGIEKATDILCVPFEWMTEKVTGL
jgi:hypothetical protein